MTRAVLLSLCFLFSAVRGSAQVTDTAWVRSAELRWAAAIGHRDTLAIAPLLDPQYVSTLEDGTVVDRATTLQQVLVPDPADTLARVTASTLTELRVRQFGPATIVATGIDNEHGANRHGAYLKPMRFTDTYVHAHGRAGWVCVASQYTDVLAP